MAIYTTICQIKRNEALKKKFFDIIPEQNFSHMINILKTFPFGEFLQ